MFGTTRTNSSGRVYSPRDVAEEHIIEDLGFLPTLERYIKHMELAPWMGGPSRRKKKTAGKSEGLED